MLVGVMVGWGLILGGVMVIWGLMLGGVNEMHIQGQGHAGSFSTLVCKSSLKRHSVGHLTSFFHVTLICLLDVNHIAEVSLHKYHLWVILDNDQGPPGLLLILA